MTGRFVDAQNDIRAGFVREQTLYRKGNAVAFGLVTINRANALIIDINRDRGLWVCRRVIIWRRRRLGEVNPAFIQKCCSHDEED